VILADRACRAVGAGSTLQPSAFLAGHTCATQLNTVPSLGVGSQLSLSQGRCLKWRPNLYHLAGPNKKLFTFTALGSLDNNKLVNDVERLSTERLE
jgi:hypothetical protein